MDFRQIKILAKEYVDSGKFNRDIKSIGKPQISKTISELKELTKKNKGLENLLQKIIKTSQSKNESTVGITFLYICGFHFLIKTLIAIKKQYTFKEYLIKLIAAESDWDLWHVRDLILSISFLIFSIVYFVSSNNYYNDEYKIDDNIYTKWECKWININDYSLKDSYKKEYIFKYKEFGDYDILYQGKVIGKLKDNKIYSNSPNLCLYDAGSDSKETNKYIKVDLEKFLLKKGIQKEVKDKINSEIKRNKEIIDSLEIENSNRKKLLLESSNLSKKLLGDIGINYEDLSGIEKKYPTIYAIHGSDVLVRIFSETKSLLSKNNNMGYMGLFTLLLIKSLDSFELQLKSGRIRKDSSVYNLQYGFVVRVFNKIKECDSVLSQLRDSDGNKKNIMTFDSFESLDDALERLKLWRIVNSFIRNFPPTQKNLIWNNGFFIDSLKKSSQSLIESMLDIEKDPDKSINFLSKISSLRTTESIIESIYRMCNNKPWNFDFWKIFLNEKRNVVVTYESKEENIIVCAVFTYNAIKEIAYMTNWCIVRDKYYYNSYTSDGKIQYVIYNFNEESSENKSVIGLTLTSDFKHYTCHDKSDRGVYLPSNFVEGNSYYATIYKKKYFQIKMSKLIKKLDKGLFKVFMLKLRNILSKGPISTFLDFYENGD